jgi:copper chaperone
MSTYPHGVSPISSPHDLTYLVPGMTCAHCKAAVTDEVARVPGVVAVHVDLESKVVRVQGTELDGAAVVAAIDEAGYDAVTA